MNDPKPRLLIVEDDVGLQKQLRWSFDEYEVIAANNRAEAIAALRRFEPAVVLQDLGLPPDPNGVSEGMQTLREILSLAPLTKVIVITGHGDRENAVRSVSSGAYDFCQKPVDTDMLRLIVSRAFHIHDLERQNRDLAAASYEGPIEGFIATDEAMLKVCRVIDKVAPTDVSVLILGESGTGKELVARALHAKSGRAQKRFVAITCAAIPEQLLESELFGYERGAFTGAVKQTIGKVELASGGTLFLDEIGDMPLALQAKLLRFLQSRVIERVGGREEIPVDVRVVCATNKDLQALITEQQFRQDLYFRVGEVTIAIPPLRERKGGATVLAHAMLRKFSGRHGKPKRGFSEDALAALETYSWPGNVRELENHVAQAIAMAGSSTVLKKEHLLPVDKTRRAALDPPTELETLREVLVDAERRHLQKVLRAVGGHRTKAASVLGISRKVLWEKLKDYGIE